jgi:hypothetical protein
MIGNLESGGYSLVSYDVTSRRAGNFTGFRRNETGQAGTQALPQDIQQGQQANVQNFAQGQSFGGSQDFKFQIAYTDNSGERRIVNMTLPLNLGTSGNFTAANFRRNLGSTATTSTSIFSWSNWYYGVIIVLVIFILYTTYRKRKTLPIHSEDHPEWIKKVKKKED